MAICAPGAAVLVDIPKGHGRGHWQRVLADEYGDNPRWSAVVWCPDCGLGMSAINHTINANGQISPSLGHPTEYPSCGWHTHPRLIGWANDFPPTPIVRMASECECCHSKSRSISNWGMGWGYKLVCDKCIAIISTPPVS